VTYVRPDGHLQETGFNPWSINLYDEDIAEILTSGGIIGLSLDQRILGAGKLAREKMSRAETFSGVTPDRPAFAVDPGEGASIKNSELHFRHFCNNLFHIVKGGKQIQGFGDEAWKRVVIGSDFDGLIDAVDFCCTAEDYKNIETWLTEKLPAVAAEAGIELPEPLSDVIQGIMFNNALEFVKKYF
jgi:microsomal dipeptidase-like Zn-dependent dipeptidase